MPKLVRLIPEQLSQTSDADKAIAQRDGYLWIWDEAANKESDLSDPDPANLRWYRSLATGYVHLWYDNEVEESNDE